jgi:type III secretion protein R
MTAGSPSFLYDPTAIILVMSTLSMAPFIAMMISSFVKLVVVTNLIRQALGLQQVPPNMVINGLAIILTTYIMAPVIQDTIRRSIEVRESFKARASADPKDYELDEKFKPFVKSDRSPNLFPTGIALLETVDLTTKQLTEVKALFSYAVDPIHKFLKKHSDAHHRAFFVKMAKRLWPKEFTENLSEDNPLVLIPAFTISELTTSFEIGFLIYLPFITVDLVVSNILLAMGMMMVSPMTISLPFKLMLFVLVNGWSKLIEALLLTYR